MTQIIAPQAPLNGSSIYSTETIDIDLAVDMIMKNKSNGYHLLKIHANSSEKCLTNPFIDKLINNYL